MSADRKVRYLGLAALLVSASAYSVEFECREPPAVLPDEAWGPHEQVSADELYRRAREALDHWSGHRRLLRGAYEALSRLIAMEPNEARGHIELARLVMMVGRRSTQTFAADAYDFADSELRRALKIDPDAGEAWILVAVLKMHFREDDISRIDPDAAADALRQAERAGAQNPRLALNWADWHLLHFDYDLAEQRIKEALDAPGLNARSAGIAYRKLADSYRKLHKPMAANRALQEALKAEPSNPKNWVAYSAFLLEDRTDTAGAVEAARQALCLYPLVDANRRLAYALYFDWARDNVDNPYPQPDDRAREAYGRYPNWRDVMGYAAEDEDLAPLVEILVRIGAPVDEKDPLDDMTALYEAVTRRHTDEAVRLIELGADVNRMDENYGALLMIAAADEKTDMARLLLEHGADVNAHSKQGTALMMAVASGNKAMTKLLLAAGADANIGDDTGQTPLSIAAMDELRGSLDIVRALLRAGADPNQLVGGTTLVEMAKGWGLSGAGELLEQAAREQSLGD